MCAADAGRCKSSGEADEVWGEDANAGRPLWNEWWACGKGGRTLPWLLGTPRPRGGCAYPGRMKRGGPTGCRTTSGRVRIRLARGCTSLAIMPRLRSCCPPTGYVQGILHVHPVILPYPQTLRRGGPRRNPYVPGGGNDRQVSDLVSLGRRLVSSPSGSGTRE